jgi:hypothetical protein
LIISESRAMSDDAATSVATRNVDAPRLDVADPAMPSVLALVAVNHGG